MNSPTDTRTSAERIEDLAFENRIAFLTHHRRWDELKAVQLVYASALADREAGLRPFMADPVTEAADVIEGEFVGEDPDAER